MFTRTKLKFVASIFIIAIYLMVPVFAYDTEPSRASKQIMSYSMDVKSTGNGRIAIIFSVDGTGKMKHIGAERITVYQQVNGIWVYANSIDQNGSGMSANNTYYYGNTIYYNGISGEEYRVEVTIFAEDASGSDSRTQTFYVTA